MAEKNKNSYSADLSLDDILGEVSDLKTSLEDLGEAVDLRKEEIEKASDEQVQAYNDAIGEIKATDAMVHRTNKSIKELEQAQRKAEARVRTAAQQYSIAAKRMTPIANSKIMPKNIQPKQKNVHFDLPYQSPQTERWMKTFQNQARKEIEKRQYAAMKEIRELKKAQESDKILPFEVNSADHARGVDYKFIGAKAKQLAKELGTDFISASKTGYVPRSKRVDVGNPNKRNEAAEYGTGMHEAFAQLALGKSKNEVVADLQRRAKKGDKFANAVAPGGKILKRANQALLNRQKFIEKNLEETLLVERGVGGAMKINGKVQNRVGTIDRLFRDKKTGELIIEDYKNEKDLKPFEHFAQEAALAALVNSQLGLIKDIHGKVIKSNKPITRGRIAQYNSDGVQSFAYFNFGKNVAKDYQKYLSLQEKYEKNQISEADFFKQLPPAWQKAYADQYGPVQRRQIVDATGKGASWLNIALPGFKEATSLSFDEKAKPTTGNKIFAEWRKDPIKVASAFSDLMKHPLVPDDYKKEMYWKAYRLGSTIFDSSLAAPTDIEFLQKFSAMVKQSVPSSLIQSGSEADQRLYNAEKERRSESKAENFTKRDLDTRLKEIQKKKDLIARAKKEPWRASSLIPYAEREKLTPYKISKLTEIEEKVAGINFSSRSYEENLADQKELQELTFNLAILEASKGMSVDDLYESGSKNDVLRGILRKNKYTTEDIEKAYATLSARKSELEARKTKDWGSAPEKRAKIRQQMLEEAGLGTLTESQISMINKATADYKNKLRKDEEEANAELAEIQEEMSYHGAVDNTEGNSIAATRNSLARDLQEETEWSNDIKRNLFASKHLESTAFGMRMLALSELLKHDSDPMTKEQREAHEKEKRKALEALTFLAPHDLENIRNRVTYSSDTVTSAQEKFAASLYEAEAQGQFTDWDDLDEQTTPNDIDSWKSGESIAYRLLQARAGFLKRYIPQGMEDEDRERIARYFDRELGLNSHVTDVPATLAKGFARSKEAGELYNEVIKGGRSLTPEQQKEALFSKRINDYLAELANSDASVSGADMILNFGEKLHSDFLKNIDGSSETYVDYEGLKEQYGEYAVSWLKRYLSYLSDPNEAELEQRAAEAFQRKVITPFDDTRLAKNLSPDHIYNKDEDDRYVLAAKARYYNRNFGGGAAPGLDALDYAKAGIPLSQLSYKYESIYAEDGERLGSSGRWTVMDDAYLAAFENAGKRTPAAQAASKASSKKKKAAKAVAKAVEQQTAAIVQEQAAAAVEEEAPQIAQAAVSQASEAGSAGQSVVSNGEITIIGNPVNVTGSPVNITGAAPEVKFEDATVFNEGSGPLTQNIYTTGNIIMQGGGPGGSGQGGPQVSQIGMDRLPLAQQYEYWKGQEFRISGELDKQTLEIEKLGASPSDRAGKRPHGKHANEIEARKAEAQRLGERLLEAKLAIKKISESAGPEFDDILTMTDQRYHDKQMSRMLEYAVDRGKLKDEIEKQKAGERYDDYKALEGLYGQRSDVIKRIHENEYKKNLSNSDLEKNALDALNQSKAKELDLIQAKINAMKASGNLDDDQIRTLEQQAKATDNLNDLALKAKNKGITNIWESLSVSFKNMVARFTQMGLAYSILNKVKKAFSEVTQSAAQLNKVMTGLRIVTGDSYEDAHQLMAGYADLASQLAATTIEVATAGQEWLRQGYDIAKVNDLITSSIQLSTLGMMSSADATKALTSAMKGFKMEASQASDIVDKFTTLDMRAATTAGDIATALSKFATTAQMAGLNIDQASAMATTIMDISQSDAGATGNALKTILSRYGNVKAGTFQSMSLGDSDDTTDKINDIERVLNTLGIQVRTSAREMRDFDDVLADIAEKWDYLDKVSQNAIATALAGTRQREAFAVLMNNYDRYQELLKVSQDSEGMAAKKYQSYLESLEASQKRLKAAWEDFANESGIAEFLTNLNNIMAPFVKNVLPSLIKYVSKLIFTLNSYKYPKILAGLFAPNKGMVSGLFGGLTSGGMQKKAAEYSMKEFSLPFTKFTTSTNKAGSALDKLALSADKASAAVGSGGIPVSSSGVAQANGYNFVPADPSAGAALTATAMNGGALYSVGAVGEGMVGWIPSANLVPFGSDVVAPAGTITEVPSASAGWVVANPSGYTSSGTPIFVQKNNASKNRFGPSKEGAMMAGASALASIAESASIGQQGMNWQNMGGGLQKASDEAATAATINSVLSSIGYIWGPIVGMITNTIADLLNKFLIIPWIDNEENERKAYQAYLEKISRQITSLSDNISQLSSVAKLTEMTTEDYKEMKQAVDDFLEEVYSEENATTRRLLTENFLKLLNGQKVGNQEITSLKEATDAYLEGTKEDREKIARALEASQILADAAIEYSKKGPGGVSTPYGIGSSLLTMIFGAIRNNPDALGKDFVEQFLGKFSEEDLKDPATRAEMLDFILSQSFSDENSGLTAFLNNDFIREALATERDSIQEQLGDARRNEKNYNVSAARAAILTGKNGYGGDLLSTSNSMLKSMGLEEIRRLIGEELQRQGGLVGHDLYDSEGNLTEYAKEIIDAAMKENSLLNGILTGASYSLRDLASMAEGEQKEQLAESFANALNLGVEEFKKKLEEGTLVDEYGNLSLGELSKTAEETRSTILDLCGVFDELNSAAGLTAEGLEKLLSNFPELVKYVGDGGSLNAAIIKNLDNYKKDYARKIVNSITSNSGVFDQYKYDLQQLLTPDQYESLIASSIFGNAKSLDDIKAMIFSDNPEDFGISPETQERMRELWVELFDNIDTDKLIDQKMAQTMSTYLKKANEREIKALEEQKKALQDINKQREYENKLIEARNRLEEAGKEKKRVWREGVGWVYESDQEALKEAQKNLEEVQNEKNIRELELQIEQLQAWNEALDKIFDDSEFENLKESYDAWAESNGLIADSMQSLIQQITGLQKGGSGQSNTQKTSLQDVPETTRVSYANAKEAGQNLNKAYAEMLDAESVMRDKGSMYGKDSQEYLDARRAYAEKLQAFQDTAKQAKGSKESEEFFNNNADASKYLDARAPELMFSGDRYLLNWTTGYQSAYPGVQEISGILLQSGGTTYESINKAFRGQGGLVGYYYNPEDMDVIKEGRYKGLKYLKPNSGHQISNAVSLTDWLTKNGKEGMIVSGGFYKAIIHNKKPYYFDQISNDLYGTIPTSFENSPGEPQWTAAARGSLGLPGGPTLLNEMGTEAVVTPYGTVTSLPSGSGVVPADVTKNLWALGDVAPGLLRLLEIARPTLASGSADNHSLSVGVINMDVHADKDFDVDTWVSQLRDAAYLKKNS